MRKKFLIGIDSDGTVFDSMTLKHRNAFIPAMIKVWKLEPHAELVYRICEKINLFSRTRGIDRFSGLIPTFREFAENGIQIPDLSPLEEFLKTGKRSNAALEAFLREHESDFLTSILNWSRMADARFQQEVEKLPPFRNVLPALLAAHEKADIAVISSASEESLRKDWQKEHLVDHITILCGQEAGSKKEQLRRAIDGAYPPECTMMIGDAPGDLEAAQAVGAWFYPVIPGREEESWRLFREQWLPCFFSGGFHETEQQKLLEPFFAATGE